MSAGIRSGVNWTRLVSSPSTMPSVSTSLVLARPGTPISRPWPPASRVTSVCSITSSWPKITLPTAVAHAARRSRRRVRPERRPGVLSSAIGRGIVHAGPVLVAGPRKATPILRFEASLRALCMHRARHGATRQSPAYRLHRCETGRWQGVMSGGFSLRSGGPAARSGCRPQAAAGGALEPRLLRRHRHPHRARRHLVPSGHADRPQGTGAAVLHHPAQGRRRLRARHAGREDAHRGRGCAVPGRADGRGRRGREPAADLHHQCRR